jgi:(R,R)-butanediol dehydrogenase / meso-butanediol dehydrogenase / diacetyl reductase
LTHYELRITFNHIISEDKSMKGIIFHGNRRCEVREFPVPEPGDGEVLIRIMATGVCGSDLHVYRRDEASDQIRGHEPCGVVEKVGANVGRLKPGDRVSVHHHMGCGRCVFCAEGEVVACRNKQVVGSSVPGSFAEFMVAREHCCVPLPDSVSFIDGAFMACIGGTAFAALRRLGAKAHDTLAVFGLGPVGLSCVRVAKAMGLRVIGADILQERVELALKCGADDAINAAETDPVERVRAFSRIAGIDYIEGVDHIIEASGSTAGRENILPSLRRGGNAAIVGVGSTEKVINPTDIHGKAATLIGSVVFPLGWSWDLAQFLAATGLSFEPIVTHRYPLADAEIALATADAGRCGKVVFLPEA